MQNKFSRTIGVLYILILLLVIVFTSFIAIQFRIFVGFDVFYTEEQFRQISFSQVAENYKGFVLLQRTVPFVVGVILFIFYTISFFNSKNYLNSQDRLIRKILNLPVFGFLSTFIGWLSGNTLDLISRIFILGSLQEIEITTYLIRIGIGVLFGVLVGVLIYYSIEFLNQNWILPKYFSKGEILRVKGSFSLTLPRRFLLVFLTATILPLFSLNSIALAASMDMRPMLMYSGFFLILSFLVSMLQTRFFKRPLETLDKMALEINDGVYDRRAPIVSHDEIGRLSQSFNTMSEGLKERDIIKDTFGKMVDPAIRDHLLGGNIKLGGELYHATVLFSDIRDFTTISEQLAPERIVDLLNRYFYEVTEAILEEEGLINKFIGDAVMVLFGMPIKSNDHAHRAVCAAEKIIARREALNQKLKNDGFPILKTGIGIHTGELVAGNIGSPVRMEYTAIGDTVNVAARLEASCKVMGTDIIFSAQTFHELPDKERYHKVGNLKVRGREEAVMTYSFNPNPTQPRPSDKSD